MSSLSLRQKSLGVIPAEAGIPVFQQLLDPGFCRGDGFGEFRKSLLCLGKGRCLSVLPFDPHQVTNHGLLSGLVLRYSFIDRTTTGG